MNMDESIHLSEVPIEDPASNRGTGNEKADSPDRKIAK